MQFITGLDALSTEQVHSAASVVSQTLCLDKLGQAAQHCTRAFRSGIRQVYLGQHPGLHWTCN